MSDKITPRNSKYRVAVRAAAGGGYTYEIFTVSGEPGTLRSGPQSYTTLESAVQAGFAAVAELSE